MMAKIGITREQMFDRFGGSNTWRILEHINHQIDTVFRVGNEIFRLVETHAATGEPVIYQDLLDLGYSEDELETRIGEGWTVSMLARDARANGYAI
jgi:hypothetical protein